MKNLKNQYNKAVLNLQKIENEINDRLWELAEKYPQAVIYQYKTDTVGTVADVKAIIFSSKRQLKSVWVVDKLEYIKAIEKHIEDLNPRRQLKLDLKDRMNKPMKIYDS